MMSKQQNTNVSEGFRLEIQGERYAVYEHLELEHVFCPINTLMLLSSQALEVISHSRTLAINGGSGLTPVWQRCME